MATIREVAERAGVSTMTVSRVINNSGYTSRAARARVEAVIAEMGYVPNALARSLRFKQTKTLALVLSDITNPFFTTIARGVEDVANRHGFNVIFGNTDESEEKQAEYLNVLVQKQVDGVLLVPALSTEGPVAFLRSRGVPVVVLDRRVPECSTDGVRGDSVQGGYELTKLLLGLGHRRIAILSGPPEVSTAADRVAGYRRALAEAGLNCDPVLILHGLLRQAGGYQMTQQALALTPRPTALFAANNFIAIGAYRALRDARLHVPDDLAMVAFDDLPPALILEPFLTVAAQPAYEMGQCATEMLLARLAGKGPDARQEVVLPVEIIIRCSSGNPLTGE
ncbi:MAG: LacI family transcriptional regulator [Anaerolineae bacterium]|nr:LacI family transcriptional regulator [Anaerolineae bacterium]